MPPTLAHHPHYRRKHATHATHFSMPPTPLTLARTAHHFSDSLDSGYKHFSFHKQIKSGLSPQSCFIFSKSIFMNFGVLSV